MTNGLKEMGVPVEEDYDGGARFWGEKLEDVLAVGFVFLLILRRFMGMVEKRWGEWEGMEMRKERLMKKQTDLPR